MTGKLITVNQHSVVVHLSDMDRHHMYIPVEEVEDLPGVASLLAELPVLTNNNKVYVMFLTVADFMDDVTRRRWVRVERDVGLAQ